jgi:hypothetical protein
VFSSLFSLDHEGALESYRQEISRIGDRFEYLIKSISHNFGLVSEQCAHAESHWNEGINREVVCNFQILYRNIRVDKYKSVVYMKFIDVDIFIIFL